MKIIATLKDVQAGLHDLANDIADLSGDFADLRGKVEAAQAFATEIKTRVNKATETLAELEAETGQAMGGRA